MMYRRWVLVMACLIFAMPAAAYIGPGAGISFVGSLFSALAVVLLTVFTVLAWPLRYMWRRARRLLRESRNPVAAEEETNDLPQFATPPEAVPPRH
jgi:hypothetical protein